MTTTTTDVASLLSLSEDTSPEDLPLSTLFQRASAVAEQADALPSGTDDTNQAARTAIAWLGLASDRVSSAGVFSTNEDADDIATGDLQYLMIPYHAANLYAIISEPGKPDARMEAISTAQLRYSEFLDVLDRYGLLGESAAMFRQEEAGALDATALRAAKIAAFKREKAIKAKLDEIRQRRVGRLRSAAFADIDEDEDGPSGSAQGADDEEDERSARFLQLELGAQKAMAGRKSLGEEVKILAHMATMSPEQRAAPPPAPPPELVAELRKVASGLSQRDQIKAGVFRPGHNLPTMSLQELAEIETADAMRRAEAEAAQEAERQRRAEELGSDEDEEELQRQRAFDDFKDDNPKGWGNSRIRPCGC